MLRLNDPLWAKLDDAHRDRDIPALLRSLAETWNDDAATSLFYDCLCHQGTCYGATYAALPHLIEIAQQPDHRHQRLEIAVFLGQVALNGLEPRENKYADRPGVLPNGLPKARDEWDWKLSYFDDVPAMDVGDLRKIERIRKDFFAALPAIRELCERAFLENPEDDEAPRYLLSGVAAADRLVALADLLEGGAEGNFRCSSCDRNYRFLLFTDRLAIYRDDDRQGRSLQDYKEGAPSRCDGFVQPAADSDLVDPLVAALFALAMRARSARPALLLRHFLGTFRCVHCGSRSPICAF
jgi:hypothetical protein